MTVNNYLDRSGLTIGAHGHLRTHRFHGSSLLGLAAPVLLTTLRHTRLDTLLLRLGRDLGGLGLLIRLGRLLHGLFEGVLRVGLLLLLVKLGQELGPLTHVKPY